MGLTAFGNKANCLICSSALKYLEKSEPMRCFYCGSQFDSQAKCEAGHFVCDSCHGLPAIDLISHFCKTTSLCEPSEMARILMRDERIKMHGPEHHFLVPAVLLAAFYNSTSNPSARSAKIDQARKRAQNVLGGFCGFYGTCGAAVGTGIFISLITSANPLSTSEWQLANLMTAQSLKTIALLGGPRCCKRNTFLALIEACDFVAKYFNVPIEIDKNIRCEFSALNRECISASCPFYVSEQA